MKPSIVPIPESIRYFNGCSDLSKSEIFEEKVDSIKDESYSISIDNNRILIQYSSDSGKFYAHKTLELIKSTTDNICDNLFIEDSPLFEYRCFMIDCCRHFFTVDELKKVIESAALFKMNKFHWHLTDDQGWRVPVRNRPELTEKGGKRRNSLFGRVNEGEEYSHSFSVDEIKEIIDFCRERFIEVIPEIEMPGHTTALLSVYPQLGCFGKPVEVAMKEGIFDTVICLGKEETMSVIKDILDSVCELFPGKYIHIGGDEAPRMNWKKCPDCQKKMKELGTDNYDKLQGYFIKEICSYLREKGKIPISWNESLKGDCLEPGEVIIHRWMDKEKLTTEFNRKGGKYIEADFYHYYCDYPYGMTPANKTYNFNPFTNCIDKENLIGIEAEMWTEYIRSFENLEEKFYPRMVCIAESAWSRREKKSYKDFVSRFEKIIPVLNEKGINVIPENKWILNPLLRLPDILRFFKGSFSISALINSHNNNKQDK